MTTLSANALGLQAVHGGTVSPLGAVMHPGVRAVYVRSTGQQDLDPTWLVEGGNFYPTVKAALAAPRSGVGDVVNVLPGHVETIDEADEWSDLVAGTKIVGWGRGQERPTFTYSAAAATILMNVANVQVFNCRFEMAGDPTATTALTVAAPVTVSAAGCGFYGCYFGMGVDADQIVTIGITTTAAADDFEFMDNDVVGAANADSTTFLRLVGLSNAKIYRNRMVGSTSSAAVGLIQALTTAPVNVDIVGNRIQNNATGGTACITGMTGLSGNIAHNLLRNAVDASNAQIATPGNAQLFENYGVNDDGETGILLGTASV